MAEGAHYVEITLLNKGNYSVLMGVVRQGFDVVGGRRLIRSTEGWAFSSSGGWLLHAGTHFTWEGQPQGSKLKVGDVAGMLLDLGQHTGCRSTSTARGVV